MSIVSAGDIVKCAQLACFLYDIGFSKAQNAERLYANFGADIQHLGRNLQKLAEVIKRVTTHVPQTWNSSDYSWDLVSLGQILGNFKKTISDCHVLLRAKSAFQKDNQGFVKNVQWNLTIQPEVARLRDRVMFHNIKIATMLGPLELKLLLDLRNMVARIDSRLEDIQDHLRRIEAQVVRNAGATGGSRCLRLPPDLLEIPTILKHKIDTTTYTIYPNLADNDHKGFPLLKGINAFHSYFDQSTVLFKPEVTGPVDDLLVERVPEPTQYLNLMKSIWIVKYIRQGQDYADMAGDAIWKCYIDELERKCRRECLRFTAQEPESTRLRKPDQNNFSLLQNDEFRILLVEDIEIDDMEGSDYLNEVLRVSLSSQTRNKKEELVLLRYPGVDDRIEIQTYAESLSGPQNRTISELDLAKVYLLPLYAYPRSTALNVTLKPDSRSGSTTILHFKKLKDLLEFQQAITTYKVVLDKTDLQFLSYQSTGIFSGKQTLERGRLQIWYRRPLDRVSDFQFGHPALVAAEGLNQNLAVPLSPHIQQGANLSPPSSPQDRRNSTLSIPSTGVSTQASTGVSSRMSTTTIATTFTCPVVNSPGIDSLNFQKPTCPLLVLFLESTSQTLSFLAIYIDVETHLSPRRCDCGRNSNTCTHSTLERSSNGLRATRKIAQQNSDWNLAVLSFYQQNIKEPELNVQRLKHVQITFKNARDRSVFEEQFEITKNIFKQQLANYWQESEKVKAGRI